MRSRTNSGKTRLLITKMPCNVHRAMRRCGGEEVRLKLSRIYFTVSDMDRARAEIEKARALGRIDQETTYTLLRAMQMGERAEAMESV